MCGVGLFGMRSYCYVLFSLFKLHMDLGDASITFRIFLKLGIAQHIFFFFTKALPRCANLRG